jgi:hypothetical protein
MNEKQNTLLAGDNITITNNTISSTGGGVLTQADLDTKQDILTTTTDLTLRNFMCDSITSGGVNLNTSLDSKQSTLTPFSNLSINKVSTLSDITAGGNLLFMDNSGTKNVKTEFSASNTAINNKQDKINFLTDLTCATLACSNLNVTGNSTVGPILNIGINDASTTPKTIFLVVLMAITVMTLR